MRRVGLHERAHGPLEGCTGSGILNMPVRGPAPKDDDQRHRRIAPVHGWTFAEGEGWTHGPVPKPPPKLTRAAVDAWSTWMCSWFAWFWGPEDLPGLRQLIRLYDQVERGEFRYHNELRIAMDTYGIARKGQQDRRWRRQLETPSPPALKIARPPRRPRVTDG